MKPAFLLANFIFALSGSEDLNTIAHYNSRGGSFSDDGTTLPNAIGKRLSGLDAIDQFAACRSLLARDPNSRRAVISLFSPEDAGSPSRDCPCLLHLQFLKRRNALSCLVGVRSQSAAMLFPHDAFLVSMLQESLAVSLKATLGPLVFHFGSLHYYEDEASLVDAVLAEPAVLPDAMPPMKLAATEVLAELTESERAIRTGEAMPRNTTLDDYWLTYLTALNTAAKLGNSGDSPKIPDSLQDSVLSCLF